MKQNIIAVDFDGTLCENKWPEIGMPNEELIEYLKKRQANGEKLILWTSRNEEQTKEAVEWCKEHGLIFDAVNDNLPEIVEAFGGNCRKIFANEYIDDRSLMQRLANAGTDHRKFMRMSPVYVRITAPLYWWKEFDTYKVGTVANSCSTMHKIQAKEFTMDDFSCEHLDIRTKALLEETIKALNDYRKLYIEYNADDFEIKGCPSKKDIWWRMIQLLPSSYNQTRNVMMNYEVLANIYKSRRGHKLDEWCDFCKWIETLPYSEIIMSSSGLDLNSINALQGAARNSSNGYIYKRKTED